MEHRPRTCTTWRRTRTCNWLPSLRRATCKTSSWCFPKEQGCRKKNSRWIRGCRPPPLVQPRMRTCNLIDCRDCCYYLQSIQGGRAEKKQRGEGIWGSPPTIHFQNINEDVYFGGEQRVCFDCLGQGRGSAFFLLLGRRRGWGRMLSCCSAGRFFVIVLRNCEMCVRSLAALPWPAHLQKTTKKNKARLPPCCHA